VSGSGISWDICGTKTEFLVFNTSAFVLRVRFLFYSVWQYAIATHISLSTQNYFHYKRAKLNVHQLVHNLADGPSTSAALNHPVFRKEIFGILLNVLDTSQTLSLLDTVNEVIFLAVIGR